VTGHDYQLRFVVRCAAPTRVTSEMIPRTRAYHLTRLVRTRYYDKTHAILIPLSVDVYFSFLSARACVSIYVCTYIIFLFFNFRSDGAEQPAHSAHPVADGTRPTGARDRPPRVAPPADRRTASGHVHTRCDGKKKL